jgi:hypothetical protein
MTSTSLRFEDRLDGASNLLSWKVSVTLLLEENDLWDIFKNFTTLPIDLQELEAHNKKVVKVKQMILDTIKDHLIPHVSKNKTMKDIFDFLVRLYQI